MIKLLYGPDTYRSRRRLQEIIADFRKTQKTGVSLRQFEGKKLSFQDVRDELQTSSMFKEKKLIILSDVFNNEGFKEEFLENFEKLNKSQDVIIFHAEEVLAKDPLFRFLKKEAETEEFELLSGSELKAWLKKEFDKYSMDPEPQVLDKLIVFVGGDLWQLSNEVQKLSLFKKGGEVTLKDVSLLVKPKIETDIFKTIDAIASGNKKEAISLLHKHLEKGDSHVYLLHMISYQFRNLLIVKDLLQKNTSPVAAKKSGLHPFVFRKSSWQAEKFTYLELKKIYRKIFEVDHALKTGKLEPETALDLLVAGI